MKKSWRLPFPEVWQWILGRNFNSILKEVIYIERGYNKFGGGVDEGKGDFLKVDNDYLIPYVESTERKWEHKRDKQTLG